MSRCFKCDMCGAFVENSTSNTVCFRLGDAGMTTIKLDAIIHTNAKTYKEKDVCASCLVGLIKNQTPITEEEYWDAERERDERRGRNI